MATETDKQARGEAEPRSESAVRAPVEPADAECAAELRPLVEAERLPAALEALLFAAGDPLSLDVMALCTGYEPDCLSEVLENMRRDYETRENAGLLLREIKDGWFFSSKPQYASVLAGLFKPLRKPSLTQAAYEVLAIVAYNQPCTRAQIEAVRGVNSDSLVSRLEERGLIAACGVLDAPGRPTLFETTQAFLIEMNLRAVSELPPMEMLMYANLQDLEHQVENAAASADDDKETT